MILFPNAKINIGLQITSRRADGYHNISTVMVPVDWCDVLEITPSDKNETEIVIYGRKVDCPPEKNLVIKAYNAVCAATGGLPPVTFHLEKIIPDGAGMGGGSADAAFAIKGLNELFNIGMSDKELAAVALNVGADCPFFIYNRPALCEGIGEEISFDVELNLKGKPLLIVKPKVAAVSTRDAYAGVTPHPSEVSLSEATRLPAGQWKGLISNDFEKSVFKIHPVLSSIKDEMYAHGAVYASMTGSGAAVYGFFENANMAQKAYDSFSGCDKIVTKIL